jgi:hypothetical protein
MGTEAFWIPAALAATGALGAGASYINTKNAQGRQNADLIQGILNQQKLQSQGSGQVSALTRQIAQNTPTQIASKATGDYVSALRNNAAGSSTGGPSSSSILFGQPTSALPTNLNANSRYRGATTNAQTQTQQYGNELAGEMGNIDAATRQRQNEGLAMNTLGTNLNLLGAQSYTQNSVDQLRAQAAGQQSPWLSLLSKTLQAGAAAGAAGYGAASPTADESGAFDSSGAPIYGATSPGGFLTQGGYLINH